MYKLITNLLTQSVAKNSGSPHFLFYETEFYEIKNKPLQILQVNMEPSLLVWHKYFERSHIFCLDEFKFHQPEHFRFLDEKRIHWLTKKEKKQAERNRQWKRNAPEGLNELLKNIGSSMGGKRKTRRRKHKRNKKTKRRRKKGGHHELTILGAAVGLKLYNSLTKKKRRKRGKRKTKRK